MAARAKKRAIVRQWELVQLLSQNRQGLSRQTITERLGISRSTFYEYLKVFDEVGIPWNSETRSGEAFFRLDMARLPALVPTPNQLAALLLGRQLLLPFSGTDLVSEYDALLEAFTSRLPKARQRAKPEGLHVANPAASTAPVVTKLSRALRQGRQVSFSYQGRNDAAPALRIADPGGLRLSRDQLYFVARNAGTEDTRTFKVSRIQSPKVLEQSAEPFFFDEGQLFRDSVRVWTGKTERIRVRLSKAVANFASEWPLVPDQKLEPQPNGSVIVSARVAGLVETTPWVLSWGKEAEALEPTELRTRVREQLSGAMAHYQSAPGLARAKAAKATVRPSRVQSAKRSRKLG